MNFVSPGDRAKALAMLGGGSARRDEMLLSLARRMSWTDRQRELIERLWRERFTDRKMRRR